MKYIANHSKKLNVKLAIEAINNAKIFKQVIPYLKLHNKVPDKNYNNTNLAKVWLSIKDIEEYIKNPKKVSYKIKLEEKFKKRYTLKTTEYQMEVDFFDKLNLDNNYKKTATTIEKYIIKKIKNLNNKEKEYEIKSFREGPWNDYNIYSDIYKKEGTFKYYIDLHLNIKKYSETSYTVYYGIPVYFYIHIVKQNKEIKGQKNYLKIELRDHLKFTLVIFV